MRFKFAWWPWNIIGHYFYTTSSFVHHFKSISEFKLEWHSGNAQFGWKSAIFVPCDLEIWRMTLKNNRAPILCCVKLGHHFIAINEFKLKIQSGNAQFRSKSKIFLVMWPWNLTDDLEKQWGTSPMLLQALSINCFIHWWIQTRVTVRKHPIWVKTDFFSRVTLKFDESPWKTVGHLP